MMVLKPSAITITIVYIYILSPRQVLVRHLSIRRRKRLLKRGGRRTGKLNTSELIPLSTYSYFSAITESFYKQRVKRSLLTISLSYLALSTFPLTVYNDLFLFSPSNIQFRTANQYNSKNSSYSIQYTKIFQYNKLCDSFFEC